ncbi:MAG TPA: NUDIX domain-containing protein [Terrimesophilobacter sp.]|nr:NUDIX domain-containing protein [Terrimesophilobacter sp.]
MTALTSAGLLLYRFTPALEVWLAHMGGPFWARKDDGAWSIPKGLYDGEESPLIAAIREFEEEMGVPAPALEYWLLGEFRQSSGKVVTAYAAESDFQLDSVVSNTFPLEWPKGSGRVQDFPEVDDARWFPLELARSKAVKGQRPLLDALEKKVPQTGAPE